MQHTAIFLQNFLSSWQRDALSFQLFENKEKIFVEVFDNRLNKYDN